MRRALRDIVPVQILERRRKAFIIHGPLTVIRENRTLIEKLFRSSALGSSGFITDAGVLVALEETIKRNDPKWCSGIQRLVAMELWFRAWKRLENPVTDTIIPPFSVGA
jgi:asparagine synthase (glutamine-hydrolysing)